MAEVEWTRWSNGFEQLQVHLDGGSNSAINGLLGDNTIVDHIPLRWRDTVTYRIGIEHRIAEERTLRGGYQFGLSPVPSETLLAMTAAITEHTIAAGLTWERGPTRVALAYQSDLPTTLSTTGSVIRSGEYRDGEIEVGANWFGLTVGYDC